MGTMAPIADKIATPTLFVWDDAIDSGCERASPRPLRYSRLLLE